MTKVPSLDYPKIISALRRDGWVVVRQRGSHIRLQKHLPDEMLKLSTSVGSRLNLTMTTACWAFACPRPRAPDVMWGIGHVPPAECEQQYYLTQEAPVMEAGVN